MTLRPIFLSLLFTLTAPIAFADCALEQTACEAKCAVQYIGDDAGETGCKARCVGARAACHAKNGVDKTAEFGESAWEGTKSFVKGLTGSDDKE